MPRRSTSYGSPAIAKDVESTFGKNRTKSVKVQMRHGKDVREFVKKVEDAHKSAGKSRLVFR